MATFFQMNELPERYIWVRKRRESGFGTMYATVGIW